MRVVDFTQVLSGPLATQMLALLDAEVIKIEPPVKGDQMRSVLTDPEMAARRLSPGFLTSNLNKRSLALDLKSEAGQAVAAKLIADADVVVENFSPGVAQRLGIDYATVQKRNPKVVYCSISGYGQTGPKKSEKAYDTPIQADAGMMPLTGHEETGPTRVGFMVVDVFTGMSAAFAIASALNRRHQTGKGQYLDVAMYDSALLLMGTQVADYMVRGNVSGLMGNRSATNQPTAGAYETANGMILLATLTPTHQENALKSIGLGDMLADPLYATPDARSKNVETGQVLIGGVLKTKTTEEWLAVLKEAGVPVQAVRTLAEASADPQLDHRGLLVEANGVEGIDEPITLVGAPFIANQDGPKTEAVPPGKVGQHTREILQELGCSAAEIDEILSINGE